MSEEKEDLISLLYHDIKGKIGNIISISDLIETKVYLSEDESSELIPSIKSSAVDLFKMIELLRFINLTEVGAENTNQKINPLKELESLSEKLKNLLHLSGVGVQVFSENFSIELKINVSNFRTNSFLLVYLLLVEIENAAALNLKFEDGEKNATLTMDIYYRDLKKNEKPAQSLSKFFNLNESRVNQSIYEYWLKIIEDNNIDTKIYQSGEMLSSVILVYRKS